MIAVALRSYWRISLDDTLGFVRRYYPSLTRSSLYRMFRRYSVNSLRSVFTYGGSRYQRAAFRRSDSYFFHLFRLIFSGDRRMYLMLVHPSTRVTYVTRLEATDVFAIADAIGEFCLAIPGGVRWLFEGSGDFLQPRPVGIDTHDTPERRLFDRHGIRAARAHAYFGGGAIAHDFFQQRLSSAVAAMPDFDFEAWLMQEVRVFNQTALKSLGGFTPLDRAEALRRRTICEPWDTQ